MSGGEERCPSCRGFFAFSDGEIEEGPVCPECGLEFYQSVLTPEDIAVRKFLDEVSI